MRTVKRIEILVGIRILPLVEQALDRCGVAGYLVLTDVLGKGDRKLESIDPLTGQPEDRLIKTACLPEDLEQVLEAVRPILGRYGGSCIVFDAQSLVHGHQYDPMRGAVVRKES